MTLSVLRAVVSVECVFREASCVLSDLYSHTLCWVVRVGAAFKMKLQVCVRVSSAEQARERVLTAK